MWCSYIRFLRTSICHELCFRSFSTSTPAFYQDCSSLVVGISCCSTSFGAFLVVLYWTPYPKLQHTPPILSVPLLQLIVFFITYHYMTYCAFHLFCLSSMFLEVRIFTLFHNPVSQTLELCLTHCKSINNGSLVEKWIKVWMTQKEK